MAIVIIEVDVGEEGAANYPIKLFQESADPDWRTKATAIHTMPKDLTDPDPQAGVSTGAARAALHGTEADKTSAGKFLYRLIADGDLGARWRAARQGGAGSILDIKPKDVALLPWELLYDDHEFLALQPARPLYRLFAPNGVAEPCETLPLRVLIVVGASDHDSAIGWETELRALRRMFRADPARFDVEELLRPGRTELAAVYRHFRPHVFHFIGHGVMEGDEPALRIWNDDVEPALYDSWTPTQILADLSGWKTPMAFLNACRTGEIAGNENANASAYDMARVFARLGARCTITMQSDVAGVVAADFAKLLYGKVADGLPLHQAVARTRLEVNQQHQMNSDWAVPVLQMCCAPELALPHKASLDEDSSDAVLESFKDDLSHFVDRTSERRRICSEVVTPPAPGAAAKNVFVVHGGSGLGKTFLLRWCAQHFALRNINIRYVDFDGEVKYFLALLNLVRFGERDPKKVTPVTRRLPDAPFAAFDARMAQIADPGSQREEHYEELAGLFRNGLAEVAKTTPLLLCFDHFEWRSEAARSTIFAGDFKSVKELLLQPVEKGEVPNVKVLLAITDTSRLEGIELKWFRNKAEPVMLDTWEKKRYAYFAESALDDLFANYEQALQSFLNAFWMMNINADRWSPQVLADMREWIGRRPK